MNEPGLSMGSDSALGLTWDRTVGSMRSCHRFKCRFFLFEQICYRGGRREYRAIVTRTIEPKELGLAGAVQIARVDLRIGAKGKQTSTWLVTSRPQSQLSDDQWLELEQQRRGIEDRTHHTLDVTHREDESRVRHPNAASVLGIFRCLSNAFKQVWAQGRPKRAGTSLDWIEGSLVNRWHGIHINTRPICRS